MILVYNKTIKACSNYQLASRRSEMICPRCQSQVADGVKFCGVCGSPMQVSQTPPPQAQPQRQYAVPAQGAYVPPNQYEEYSSNQTRGNQVPPAELHNRHGPLHVADM